MKRNVAKAIKIADYLIESHLKLAKGIEEQVKDWTIDGTIDIKALALTIASTHRDVASCIEIISELLKERKIVKAYS